MPEKKRIPLHDLNIDLAPYNEVQNVSIPEIEREKYRLTLAAKEHIQREEYEEAANTLAENAFICRNQGKERDAYLLEHKAFLCRQMSIYQRAGFDIGIFSAIPYAEVLQTALTELADDSFTGQDYGGYYYFKMLNARLCRAQGKERDAFLLEQSAAEYKPQMKEFVIKESAYLQRLVEVYEALSRKQD